MYYRWYRPGFRWISANEAGKLNVIKTYGSIKGMF